MSGCCCEQCHDSEFLQGGAPAGTTVSGDGKTFSVMGYPAVAFSVTGLDVGSVVFEFLNFNVWQPLPVASASGGTDEPDGEVFVDDTYVANTTGLGLVRARTVGLGGGDNVRVVATAVCEAMGIDVGGESASDVDVLSVIPGTGPTNLGKAEDGAHGSGDVGVMALAVRDDFPPAAKAANNDYVPLLTDENGRLYVTLDGTNPQTIPSPSTTANTPSIVTATGDALAANAARKIWSVQNVGTNPIFVRLGTGASATVFHAALKGGTADSDGNGGFISDEIFKGVVSVFGTTPKFVVTELT